MGRGRPKMFSDAELAERVKIQRVASKEKTRNISVDADLVEIIGNKAEQLEVEFGFRPTISQTLRYLIKKA